MLSLGRAYDFVRIHLLTTRVFIRGAAAAGYVFSNLKQMAYPPRTSVWHVQ